MYSNMQLIDKLEFGKNHSSAHVGADIIRPAVLFYKFAATQCASENLLCTGG